MPTKSTPDGPASTKTGTRQAQHVDRGMRAPSPLPAKAAEPATRATPARPPAKATERAARRGDARKAAARDTARTTRTEADDDAPKAEDYPAPIEDQIKAEADVDPAKRSPVPDDPDDVETDDGGDDGDDDEEADGSNLDPAKARPTRHPAPDVAAALGSNPGRYLVSRKAGLKTGHGFVEAGSYVPEEWLAGSTHRLLRTGDIVDLGTGESPAKPLPAPSEDPDEGDDEETARTGDVAGRRSVAATLTAEAGKADLPTLAGDSDADGVVAQNVPVVLRFLDAHPERAGDILTAERKRAEPRKTIVSTARDTAKTYAKTTAKEHK